MIDLPIKLLKNMQRLAFLLSITSTSHFVKLQAMPLQQLRDIIELELHNDNYQTSLNNLTDDILSIKVKKKWNRSTVLTITRYPHKPLEVEVMIDYTLSNEQDIVRRIIPRTTQSTTLVDRFMNYRLLWFGMFFLGLIFMVFSVFVSILFSLLERISPSANPLQRSLGVIGAALITAVFWIFTIPFLNKRYNRSMKKYDQEIMDKICGILKILNEDLHDVPISRCWSCFKDIGRSVKLCPFCEEQQN